MAKAKLFGKPINDLRQEAQLVAVDDNYNFNSLPDDVNPDVLKDLNGLESYIVTGISNCELTTATNEIIPHTTGRRHFNYLTYRAMCRTQEGYRMFSELVKQLREGIKKADVPQIIKNGYSQVTGKESPILDFDDFLLINRANNGSNPPIQRFIRHYLEALQGIEEKNPELASPKTLLSGLHATGRIVYEDKLLSNPAYRLSLEDIAIPVDSREKLVTIHPNYINKRTSALDLIDKDKFPKIVVEFVETALMYGSVRQTVVDEIANVSSESVGLAVYEFLEKKLGLDFNEQKLAAAEHLADEINDAILHRKIHTNFRVFAEKNLPFLELYRPDKAQEIRKRLEGTK
jgi:hypothetical protein